MPLQTSGTIKFSELQAEYGGNTPVSLSEYYKNSGTGYVQAGQQGINSSIPASGSISMSNFFNAAKMLILSNPNAYSTPDSDYFGYSSAIDGNYAIIGAWEDDASGSNAGVAYIFDVTTGALVHTLNNPNAYGTSATDYFGLSVAISGNYAIVGAYGEGDAGGTFSGKAYIFNVTTGALVHTLDNPNAYGTSDSDLFGNRLAIFGDRAIISAYQEDDAGGTTSGKAYIYSVSNGALLLTIDNPNAYGTSAGDYFGSSVAIASNYAVVGAYLEADAGGSASGKAYIFDVTTGALVHTLDNPNAYGTSLGDRFGSSIAMNDGYIVYGAKTEDDVNGGDSGKVYVYGGTPSTITNLLYTIDNPNPYNTSQSDNFGSCIALSGNYLLVAADLEDDAGGSSSGKVYIYNISSGALLLTIDNPNTYSTTASDQFGLSAGISGNRIVVGAQGEEDATSFGTGKAYIIKIAPDPVLISPLHTISNPNAYSTASIDYFGYSSAISGNYAISSAPYEDDANGSASGKAYIFNVTTGALVHTLDNPNAYGTGGSDKFGDTVAIDGNYAIVGAKDEDDAGGTSSGKAYIFNVTTGALVHTLNNPNAYSTSATDYFGASLGISGNYAIVGANLEDDAGGSASGKAYIFDVTTGALVRTLDNPNAYDTSDSDYFGLSVAISGNYAIVGAHLEDYVAGISTGKAYIFNVTTGALVHTLDNPSPFGSGAGDNFGISVAIDGNYAIVGASNEDDAGGSASGKAYIFDVTTGALVHTLDNPNAYGASLSDQFGRNTAISGNYALVGVNQEDDAGGGTSGKAYIFDVTTGELLYTANNPNAYDTSSSDNFGFSVGISGNYFIAGAWQEDDAVGGSSGKAYIFNIS